jgi:hypothetical protein
MAYIPENQRLGPGVLKILEGIDLFMTLQKRVSRMTLGQRNTPKS